MRRLGYANPAYGAKNLTGNNSMGFLKQNNLILRYALITGFLYFGVTTGSFARDVLQTAAKNPVRTSRAQQESLNAVSQAAKKSGVQGCLSRINQVTNFLTSASQQSGASLFVPQQGANKSMVSVSLEIKSAQALSYANADFAPLAAGCNGSYEAITYWQNSCSDVAKGYAQFKAKGTLSGNILVLDGGQQLRVFLMPAGAGCVSIKKEIVYQ